MPHRIPLLHVYNTKTGVYKGIHFFSYVFSKNKNNINIFQQLQIFVIFYCHKISQYFAYTCYRNAMFNYIKVGLDGVLIS